jgi:hypothetical protein
VKDQTGVGSFGIVGKKRSGGSAIRRWVGPLGAGGNNPSCGVSNGREIILCGWDGQRYVECIPKDAKTWQFQPVDVCVGNISWVDNRFIALSSNRIHTSPDARSWTPKTPEAPPDLWSVAWSGKRFVAVGDSGTIPTSTDGVDWRKCEQRTKKALATVTWVNGLFVAKVKTDTILTSSDGITWTAKPCPKAGNGGSAGWGTSGIVAGVRFLSSKDGISWERWVPQIDSSRVDIESTVWTGALAVAGCQNGSVLTSPNGAVWTKRATPTSAPLGPIHWNGTQFPAFGLPGVCMCCGRVDQDTVLTSPDATTWTAHEVDFDNEHSISVCWTGREYIAIGNSGKAWRSSKGTSWTPISTCPSPSVSAAAWDGRQIVVVGQRGCILSLKTDAPLEEIAIKQGISRPIPAPAPAAGASPCQ